MLQKGVFWRSWGRGLEKFSEGRPLDPIFLPYLSDSRPAFRNSIAVLYAFISKTFEGFFCVIP